MKINSNNPHVYNTENSQQQKVRENEESASKDKSNLKDRVELNGEATIRQSSANRVNSAYNLQIDTNEDKSPVLKNVSQDARISDQRISEIKNRIENGYYESDKVLDDVAKMMAKDVKKIDHNI